jgi:SSXT protein (N-terminal region).
MNKIEIDPMKLIETQRRKIMQLTDENVALTALIEQYQEKEEADES